ncbi:MAG TPA: thiamine diphosphokinase [Trueperaceae bacterium]
MSPESGPAALVLAGGEPPAAGLLAPLLEDVGPVVAADGGLRHAAALGLAPDLIVGDLDSVTEDLLRAFPDVPVERHPRAKDELDLELALAAARRLGAASARVLGAFGGRLDQSLANLLVAARLATAEPPFPVTLHGGAHEARPCAPGLTCDAAWPPGTTVSLLALGGYAVVTATGLAYPVEDLRLPFGVGLGVSNVATGGRVVVRCAAGVVAVIAEHVAA